MPIDGLIPRDPQADIRTRQTLDALAGVLNGLIRSGDIVLEGGGSGNWRLSRAVRNPPDSSLLEDHSSNEDLIIPGPQGLPGKDGQSGPPSFLLDDGPTGEDGFPGRQGIQGIQGIPGPILFLLDDPPSGEDGFPGQKGDTGSTGPTGPAGSTGLSGQPVFILEDTSAEDPPVGFTAAAATGSGITQLTGEVNAGPGSGSIASILSSAIPHDQAFTFTDANTTGTQDVLRVERESTGTPAAGFGVAMDFHLESSTTSRRDAARFSAIWVDATDATRKSLLKIGAADFNSPNRFGLGLGTDGTNPLIAFLANADSPVLAQTGDAGTALVTFGLMTGTPTLSAANLTGYASQADQETGTSTTKPVAPGTQKFHPSAAKAWIEFDASSGTPTSLINYNVTSLTDNGTGDTTINFTTAFSTANYAFTYCGSTLTNDSRFGWNTTSAPTASAFRLGTANSSQALADCKRASVCFFGDQ